MKIVVFCLNHAYANKLVKDLIREFGSEIQLIVEPKTQLKGKSTHQILTKYLKTSGWYYTFQQSIKLLVYKVASTVYTPWGSDKNKFYNYKKLAVAHQIDIETVEDINSKSFVKKLEKLKPDLIVSVLFSHIFKAEILKVPKKGAINIHPAFLPNYKGISPVFWSIVNGEKYSGVSVHYINQGIDTGDIIKRKKIAIQKRDTEDSLYWKCVNTGSKLLIDSIKAINDNKIKTIRNGKGSYFSFPTKVAVLKYKKLDRHFFRISELLL